MKTKLIIPVIDTERGKFEYNGRELTAEEYGNMEYEHFRRTDRQVGQFVDNMRRGISNVNPYGSRMRDVSDVQHPDIYYNDEEIEVLVLDANRKDISEDELIAKTQGGKMFILILSINPNTLSGDAESEVRLWMDDSNKVINDNSLPDQVKIKSLPGREYGIVAGNRVVRVTNCKMVEDYSSPKQPYHFAIIVEKAFIQ